MVEHLTNRPTLGGGQVTDERAQYQSTAWLWSQALQGLPYVSWM